MRRRDTLSTLTILILTLILVFAPGQAQAATYTVKVDGTTLTEANQVLVSGQMMVAVRPLIQAMGGSVSWNDTARMATLSYNGSAMALWAGNSLAFQDGARIWAPVAPYLNNGQMMVPAWWLAVRFGAKPAFDGTALQISTGRTVAAPRPDHPLANSGYFFPFPAGASYQPYTDTMGDARYWDGTTFGHEGTDILAPKGTPIVAVAAGTIVRYGWNTLGGYRITVQLDDRPDYRFYYAHMDRYAPGLGLGSHVQAGQVIGYVGSTGEGPERTEGHFVTHLHFGIYDPSGAAIDPYALLKYWEAHKVNL